MWRFLLMAGVISCGDVSSDLPKSCKKDSDCATGQTCAQNPASNKAPGVDMICANPK